MSPVNIGFAVLIGVIVWTIVRSVRQVKAQIDEKMRGVDPSKREEIARELVTQVRSRVNQIHCPRCRGLAFALLDRDPWWKCDDCNWEFEGPEHLPMPEGASATGRQ